MGIYLHIHLIIYVFIYPICIGREKEARDAARASIYIAYTFVLIIFYRYTCIYIYI
jgi:hypothetical protein